MKTGSIHTIYPSIVTWHGDWRAQMKDCDRLGVRTPSLFLTGVGRAERRVLYAELVKSKIKSLPHVHIRQDHTEEELDFFVKKYRTKVFTIHFQHLHYFEKSKHKKKLFIENNSGTSTIKDASKLKRHGGVCIDLGHLEQFKRNDFNLYVQACELARDFKVGLNHLSAIQANGWHWHGVKKLSDLDYLKGIPKEFFSEYICLELVNPISEQLRFRKHIAKLLEL